MFDIFRNFSADDLILHVAGISRIISFAQRAYDSTGRTCLGATVKRNCPRAEAAERF